ncbi:hypothetical protein BCR32DRAFT_280191 [Anaeromyces robustus]|uniref:Uncharacterized protein n=1 Tax=Anaeromyces robustus TaxID=1754192 RepID=A0A1Y1X686_9FUNG|nr:hypothetical protein BCR32DRAFT_280191 [Anaeromyces robustus]|eukprot:ORX80886.1 hypothetical protein BCR32DRAFT_280191 [Anaeromyces robustus]
MAGPSKLKFRYIVALEKSFPMSIKSKRSGGNLQYLASYLNFNFRFINIRDIFPALLFFIYILGLSKSSSTIRKRKENENEINLTKNLKINSKIILL